jgi:integrase/recombinase XerD
MKVYLEQEDIKLLEETTTNRRDLLLIRLLFHLGCRISEALAITVDDVDFKHGTISIHRLKVRARVSCPNCRVRLSKSHVFCPGCGTKVESLVAEEKEHHRIRQLPVDVETQHLLGEYIKKGSPLSRNGRLLIFGINRHRAWQIVKECAERAGLPKLVNPETGRVHNVSPHRFRDAFAVNAVKIDDSGNGLRLLQEHLGHQSISTTMRYRKIAGEEHREWYQKLWSKESPANGTTA